MNESKPLYYIARDIERALGVQPSAGYQIVTNKSPYSEASKQEYPDFIHLIESTDGVILDTEQLMESAASLIPKDSGIIVFKNTSRIESIATKNGWNLLNPSAALAEKIENKITQVEWLGSLAEKYLPPHSILAAKDIAWKDEPIIIQWAHGHTGDGTMLINAAAELKEVQTKFPERQARAARFMIGPSFTVNVIVTDPLILMGNVSYQITGMPPFTGNPFATVGNDWSIPHSFLSDSEIAFVETMVQEIGLRMQTEGWRGLFGIDFMMDSERGSLHLIEINARQPASTAFESALQQGNRLQGIGGITVFEAHLLALKQEKIDQTLIPINDGAQIVQRITKDIKNVSNEAIVSLEAAGYHLIKYQNTEENSDLLRIQGMMGIIDLQGNLNKRGKAIIEVLEK